MMNVVAVGNKIVEMFQIEEYTAEAFESGMKAAGWEWEEDFLVHKTTREFPGYEHLVEIDKRVDAYNVCIEQEMKYAEYKKNFSGCQTKKDSYNKETKTIVVYIRQFA